MFSATVKIYYYYLRSLIWQKEKQLQKTRQRKKTTSKFDKHCAYLTVIVIGDTYYLDCNPIKIYSEFMSSESMSRIKKERMVGELITKCSNDPKTHEVVKKYLNRLLKNESIKKEESKEPLKILFLLIPSELIPGIAESCKINNFYVAQQVYEGDSKEKEERKLQLKEEIDFNINKYGLIKTLNYYSERFRFTEDDYLVNYFKSIYSSIEFNVEELLRTITAGEVDGNVKDEEEVEVNGNVKDNED
jgi:hypothetical protein